MARRTYPRPERHHEVAAQNILAKHVSETGVPMKLPVPIELIVESTYGISLLYEELSEEPGTMILGALFPHRKQIVINTKHADLMDRVIGPERFTLAHELAHWIYDADDPDQLALDLEHDGSEHFCRDLNAPGLTDVQRIREQNANKLAACVLLPEQLVRDADLNDVLDDFSGTARAWGVSGECLRIRLETLNLIDHSDFDRLPSW
jgi:Zn-dependent peptidase ImmA (M78 family)